MLDEMEIWQVGATLGVTGDAGTQEDDGDPLSAVPREWLEERARAVEEGRPLPDPPAIRPAGRPRQGDLFDEVPQIGAN